MKNILKRYNRISLISTKTVQNLSPLLVDYEDSEVLENCMLMIVEEISRLIVNEFLPDNYIDYTMTIIESDYAIIKPFDMYYPQFTKNCKAYIKEIIEDIIKYSVIEENYEVAMNLKKLQLRLK